MVLVALSVVVLLGFMGLGTDLGLLWSTRRRAQTAADAAASAGLNAINIGQSSTYSTAATDVAQLNGFTAGSGVVVTPSQPSAPSGYPSGTYVQVNITKPVRTFFLGALGYRTISVSVTALAGNISGSNTVIALNGSGSGVTVSGSNVTAACGVMSNSSSSSGLTVSNGGSLAAATVAVVGGTSGSVPSNTKTNVAPVQNPFSNWTQPTTTSCSRHSTNNSGTLTVSSTSTVPSNSCYSGGSGNCGISIASPTGRHGGYTPITVSFSGGNCGNHISCGGSGQSTCQNVTCNFSPGQYQCVNSGSGGGGGWGSAAPTFVYAKAEEFPGGYFGDATLRFVRSGGIDPWGGRFLSVWGSSTVTPSIEIGPNASSCTANFSSGSYTFLGNVSICGANTVNLQPGTYCNGITIADDSYGNSPTVNFAPGTYICAGGGLNISGHCTLSGTGCTFHNTSDCSDDGYSNGPISCGGNSGDSVTCSLSAPTSGSCKGMLFTQDSSIGGSSHWGGGWGWGSGSSSASSCTLKFNSSSTCDGACYLPNASCTFSGSSSAHGYTIVVADSVTLSGSSTQTHNCDYSSLSNGVGPIVTSALFK